MNKASKWDIVLFIIALVSVPVLYKLIMWLILDIGISPTILTVIFLYLILVIPQEKTLWYLKVLSYKNEDISVTHAKREKKNWIIFISDIPLIQYYGTETIFKKLIAFLMFSSAVVFTITSILINPFFTLIEFTPEFFVILIYVFFISLLIYILTKVIVVAYFLYMFGGFVWLITAIPFPIGFMIVNGLISKYFQELERAQYESSMGTTYE